MPDTRRKYRVLIHNDDATPMDFVVQALHQVFDHGERTAARLMLRVHHHGLAEVARLPGDDALQRVEKLHALASEAGHPLTASVSPVTERASPASSPAPTIDVSGLSADQVHLVQALVHELSPTRR